MLYLIHEYTEQTRRAINLCLQDRVVVPALTLLYSSVDVLGFLVSDQPYAKKQTFVDWAEKYMDAFLKEKGISGIDLYSARCGLLHTGQAPSKLVDSGEARELWYRFGGESQVNIMTNTPKPAVLIDVEELVESFNGAVAKFVEEVDSSPTLQARADPKAERFFRRGLLMGPL